MNDRLASPRIVVIGGGVTGLSAAHRLLQIGRDRGSPLDVTILEASGRIGGVVRTIVRDGFLCEAGPENFVTHKPWGVLLCDQLGLTDQILPTNDRFRRALIVRRGRLVSIPDGFVLLAPTKIWPTIRSPLFSWPGKLRIAMETLMTPRRSVDDESLAAFVTRHFGREILDRVVQPLVGGIYTADPERLSLRATMPMFLEMESEFGSVIRALRRRTRDQRDQASGARYGLFVTLRNGLEDLVSTLADRIGRQHIRANQPVTTINSGDRDVRWSIGLEDGARIQADGVIIAGPSRSAAAILERLDPEVAAMLSAIRYTSSAVVHCVFRREDVPHKLDAFGFVVPILERRRILAASFSSVKFEGRAPEGFVLIRVFLGGALQPEMMQRDDADMVAAVRADLGDLLGIRRSPRWSMVHRWPNAMPEYAVGHLDHVTAINQKLAQLPGIEVAGNGFGGVGIPDCIHEGWQAADRLLAELSGRQGVGGHCASGGDPVA